ncbi:ATP-binding protein [Methanomethylophilus alvi]|uniref:ATP-binding protein n=1 Tax=Methanomethylophilus alvi TaxID=1291540 RepID=UPI0037DDA6F1
MNGTVRRSGYLEQMHGSKGATGVIKVITGMRRCGKSTLMEQFEEDLRSEGVDSNHIFHVNFETFEGYDILSPDELRRQLRALPKDGIVYVMLDEIQDVEGWELIVSSLEEVKNYDVYITGSNSDMLSTDLSTHLSGRYIEIKMLPLSFGEYYELHPGNAEDRFVQYLRYGGLPDTDPDRGERHSLGYLEGVFSTVLVKDVLSRLRTDNVNKIRAIARFLYSNVGNITNIAAIAQGTGLNPGTVERYVGGMESALLFYHAEKYDIVGKKLLSTNGKYYASDLGMRYMALKGSGTDDLSRPLENAVYLELIRRGYTVRIGSYRDKEVDFTAVMGNDVEYYQVAMTILSEETKKREFGSLEAIRDNFPKTVLTMDRFNLGNFGGIRVVNVIDWMLGR